MESLLDSAPCGYLSFTDTGLIVDVNATLLNLLGYSPGELTNQKFETVLTISSRIFFQTHFFPLLRLHNVANEVFFTLRSKDKQDLPVLVNAVRRQQEGRYLSVCIFMPVAQRQIYESEILQAKRAAEVALQSNEELIKAKQELEHYTQELDRKISQLEQKNQEYRRVTKILFHDLWEPLRKILTFTDLIEQDGQVPASTPMGTLLHRIRGAALTISTLLRSLQEFSAVDGLNEPLAQVDLNEVVAEAKQLVTKDGRDFQISTDSLPTLEGHRQQLTMLFVQLFDNSIQFCKPDVAVTITITSSLVQHNQYRVSKNRYAYVDFVQIVLQDNSYGFDNRYSESIFNLLTKLDHASQGPGVGLAICQKIVANHFGSITASSQVGKGATFTILLPLQQNHAATPNPP